MATALAVQPKSQDGDEADDGLLDVAALVRMVEESEESTNEARKLAERDRDYYDNKQLTAEELEVLRKRGQPPGMDNRIKPKIDYLVGLEKQQRIDPKALPRTPVHEQDADGATQALRYVAETENYDNKRSELWRNLLIEGAGGIGVAVKQTEYGMEVELRHYAWDRIFWDPHSARPDFSDAGYLGTVVWMDYSDALAMYGAEPGAKEALDTTLNSAPSDTYDDKPKFNHWADKKRKRVRVCQIWLKRDEDWHFAEFTKGGILKAGPSPYRTDKGESDCELIFQSAHVDRDNNRYGIVREMIPLQDAINKRNSKTLHLLNVAQIVMEDGAVDDVEKMRKEAARPDGVIVLNPNHSEKFKFETRTDLASAHLQLLQENKNSIDLKGPNATQMGDKAQGSAAASGRAIIASQQGGMISLGDLLDSLRHVDKRVFRAIWARIRQFWDGAKWIRVTDDESNVRWVGMNVDPMQVQMAMQQNPEMQDKIAGVVGSVAELDCDIIIDEVPDVIASQEQFGMLVELKKMDAQNELPFRALVVASSIKDKAKMLEEMDKAKSPPPGADVAQQLQLAGVKAKVDETMASAGLKQAQTQKTLVEANLAPLKAQHEASMDEAGLMQRQVSHEQGLAHQAHTTECNLAQKSESEQMRAQMQQRRASVPSVRPAA